ncbi:hypothetical protein Tco_1560249 [Tanacetum coccineum]
MTKRTIWISQFEALSPVADETAPPIRGDRYGEAFPTATSLDAGQDMENIPKTSAMPHESFPRTLEDAQKPREGVQEDAPNRGGIDQGEVNVFKVLVREETSVNNTPSVVKVPICDWKIYKDKQREVYQIFRVGQAPKVYPYFESMLKDFDRDDLVTLWKLVLLSTRIIQSIILGLVGYSLFHSITIVILLKH